MRSWRIRLTRQTVRGRPRRENPGNCGDGHCLRNGHPGSPPGRGVGSLPSLLPVLVVVHAFQMPPGCVFSLCFCYPRRAWFSVYRFFLAAGAGGCFRSLLFCCSSLGFRSLLSAFRVCDGLSLQKTMIPPLFRFSFFPSLLASFPLFLSRFSS